METIQLILFLTILFFLGIVCLFFTEKVQRSAIKSFKKGFLKNSCFELFVKSKLYPIVVKSAGFIALFIFCFIIYLLCEAGKFTR